MITDEEKDIIERTKKEIRDECDTIAKSLSHILVLGGPMYVEKILQSFLASNEKVKTQFSFKVGGDESETTDTN